MIGAMDVAMFALAFAAVFGGGYALASRRAGAKAVEGFRQRATRWQRSRRRVECEWCGEDMAQGADPPVYVVCRGCAAGHFQVKPPMIGRGADD